MMFKSTDLIRKHMKDFEGNLLKEQYTYNIGKNEYFSSCGGVIVAKRENGIFLDFRFWNYDKITRKYRNLFLDKTSLEIKAKIKSGEYKLVNLNEQI